MHELKAQIEIYLTTVGGEPMLVDPKYRIGTLSVI